MYAVRENFNLLLSYTYYLNNIKNSFVSIGFDAEDFESKIIRKSKKQISFRISDWNHLMRNANQINLFFSSDQQFQIENVYGATEIKLRSKFGCKEITFGLKKMRLKLEEWKIFYQLFPYFNDIMRWNKNAEKTVSEYYYSYVKECVRCNTMLIDPNNIIPCENQKIINLRRLQIEIPILMSEKLNDDFVQELLFGYSN